MAIPALLSSEAFSSCSWLVADWVRPAVRTASVAITPQITAGQPLAEDEAAAWRDYHMKQLHSEQFLGDLARRASSRHLDSWNSLQQVRDTVGTQLMVDSSEPGRLVMTIAAENPYQAAAFLDILASSMAVGAQRSIGSRPGGHTSTVLDDRREEGVLRFARIDPTPLRDERLATASVVFAGGILACFMVMGLVYSRLLRAKRVFDETHPGDLEVPVTQARPI